MVGSLLLRGMLIGVLAGLLAFAFARTFGEPQIDAAIAFEEQASQAAGEAPEPELVSRGTQAGLGLGTGMLVFGAAVGGIFALVFAFAYGRLGSLGARATSALLALAAFVSLVLVPQIKYPANPPAVGSAETIDVRTTLFFLMLLVSVAALAAAGMLARRLWAQHGGWNATLIAAATFVGVVALIQFAMPSIDEVPIGFSPEVLWRFRIASIGIHAIFWAVIGLGFGILAEKRFGEGGARRLARSYG